MDNAVDSEKMTKIRCLMCEEEGEQTHHHYIGKHLKKFHGTNVESYLQKFGRDAPVASNEVWETFFEQCPAERKGSKRYEDDLNILNINLQRQTGKPIEPVARPKGYRYPQNGRASQAAQRVVRAFKYGRSVYIYGPAGTGKSALVRALCNDLNSEFSYYPMREGLDPELYLGKEAVIVDEDSGQNVTKYIEGKLLRDLRGRKGRDGVVRGVVILIDDFDRAPAEYHEVLRHVLESNTNTIFIPELRTHVEVHPETQIIATANSAGRGDMTGFYASVQELDESILDRFDRPVEYHFLEPDEEKAILKNKFQTLAQEAPGYFDKVIKVTEDIRELIFNQDIFVSFSHRRLVQWMQSATELYWENGNKVYKGMLREASRDWLDWYDQTTRDKVVDRVLDVHVPGKDLY